MTYQLIGGSIPGPHHRMKDEENQDSFGFIKKDGMAIIVAADGAGSLSLSHLGARLAVDVAIEEALHSSREHGLDLIIEMAIERARESLIAHPNSKLMGCTLAMALITQDAWAVGVAGDAFAVLQDGEGRLVHFSPPPAGEYANITQLLTSRDLEIVLACGEERIVAAAVATDGLETISLERSEPHPGFWHPVFAKARASNFEVDAFLAYLDEAERLDDDTTLVIATLPEGEG